MSAILDKTALNYANLFGLSKGLHLEGNQYSWLGSIFYFGYLIAQYPAGYLLQRLRTIAKFLSVCILAWGTVLMTTAACKNFAGAMANRFFLGLLESSFTPGAVLITGMYWNRDEQPLRQLAWYSAQAWAGVFGGLLGYGVGHIQSSFPQWGWIFIILGAVTIIWAAVVAFYLPDSPVTARYLTEEQKLAAVARVARNKTGVENKRFKKYQIFHALKDPKTYLLFVLGCAAQIPNSLITSFSTKIIQSMGFTQLQTTLLGIPSNLIQAASLLVAGYCASRFPNTRIIVMTVGNVVCVIAAACLAYLPLENQWGRLIAFWWTPVQSIGFSLALAMVSANISGHTKKQFTGATTFIAYCVGNIIGPFTFKNEEAPRYKSAIVAMLCGYVIKTAAGIALGVYMWAENKRRDRLQAASGEILTGKEGEKEAMLDKTEFENPYFRYSL
ncbi:MFS general substrate transporter [Atractiella rhizophila]|nr:MFS general substrate transporter [Atractiella rhizophila]